MHIDIKIAVLPLVKAYLGHHFNVEPFELSQDNQYGIFLFNCLSHVKKIKGPLPTLGINTNRYCETLTIRLSERILTRQGTFIHPDKQVGFNRMVIYSMNESFLLFIEERLQQKFSQKNAFLAFREKFSLDEDNLPLKTMEKKYERARYALIG